jgi:tetratricopeptide (TPR) repeat protein
MKALAKIKSGWKICSYTVFSLLLATAGVGAAAGGLPEADALLASPTLDRSQAARALSLYEGALATGKTPRGPLLAGLAQACFVLGQMASQEQGMEYYRKGQSSAETLIREEPQRVEGHYWLAMNLCGQAEVGGNLLGRKLLPRIIEELQRSLSLNEAYDRGGAHRVLGRIYYEAPGWPLSVGDMQKSLRHLKAAVRLGPGTSTNHLYLAQTLMRLKDNPGAEQELQAALKSNRAAVKPQDLEEDRREARRLLAEIKGGD